MTCFQVEVNGERICVAGLGEFGVLTATVSWVRNRHQSATTTEAATEIAFNVGGLTDNESGVDEFVDWVRKGLSVGDEVRITIVDATDYDEPKERKQRDPAERTERAREYYEQLAHEQRKD